jgi:hypothetical protein
MSIPADRPDNRHRHRAGRFAYVGPRGTPWAGYKVIEAEEAAIWCPACATATCMSKAA